MCALPVLVWPCLAMFCGHQPHFFATSPVLTLVTDLHYFAGTWWPVHYRSSVTSPRIGQLGTLILRHDLARSLIFRSPIKLRDYLDPFLMPPGTSQNRHGPRALSSVRPHLWCRVTQYCAPPASRLLTRTNPVLYQYELDLSRVSHGVSMARQSPATLRPWIALCPSHPPGTRQITFIAVDLTKRRLSLWM